VRSSLNMPRRPSVLTPLLVLPDVRGGAHPPEFAFKTRPPISVPNVTGAVASALATPSTCVPHHTVMLSMATTHHQQLRRLQFARISHLSCFMSRVVSVTYGFRDDFGACVEGACGSSLGLANPCIPSDYRRSQYVSLNWANRVVRTRRPSPRLCAYARLVRAHLTFRASGGSHGQTSACTAPKPLASHRRALLWRASGQSAPRSRGFGTLDAT